MEWYFALLLGGGIGLVVMPILVGIAKLYKNTKTRIQIKKMIKQNKFLIPIDPKDYDVNAWKDKINPEDYKEELNDLNMKIFKRPTENG